MNLKLFYLLSLWMVPHLANHPKKDLIYYTCDASDIVVKVNNLDDSFKADFNLNQQKTNFIENFKEDFWNIIRPIISSYTRQRLLRLVDTMKNAEMNSAVLDLGEKAGLAFDALGDSNFKNILNAANAAVKARREIEKKENSTKYGLDYQCFIGNNESDFTVKDIFSIPGNVNSIVKRKQAYFVKLPTDLRELFEGLLDEFFKRNPLQRGDIKFTIKQMPSLKKANLNYDQMIHQKPDDSALYSVIRDSMFSNQKIIVERIVWDYMSGTGFDFTRNFTPDPIPPILIPGNVSEFKSFTDFETLYGFNNHVSKFLKKAADDTQKTALNDLPNPFKPADDKSENDCKRFLDLLSYETWTKWSTVWFQVACHIEPLKSSTAGNGNGKFLSVFDERMNTPRLTMHQVDFDMMEEGRDVVSRAETRDKYWPIPGLYNPMFQKEGSKGIEVHSQDAKFKNKQFSRIFTMGHLTPWREYTWSSYNPYSSFSRVNIMGTGLVAPYESKLDQKVYFELNMDGTVWAKLEEEVRNLVYMFNDARKENGTEYEVLLITGGSGKCIKRSDGKTCFSVEANMDHHKDGGEKDPRDISEPSKSRIQKLLSGFGAKGDTSRREEIKFSERIWKMVLVKEITGKAKGYFAFSCHNRGLLKHASKLPARYRKKPKNPMKIPKPETFKDGKYVCKWQTIDEIHILSGIDLTKLKSQFEHEDVQKVEKKSKAFTAVSKFKESFAFLNGRSFFNKSSPIYKQEYFNAHEWNLEYQSSIKFDFDLPLNEEKDFLTILPSYEK